MIFAWPTSFKQIELKYVLIKEQKFYLCAPNHNRNPKFSHAALPTPITLFPMAIEIKATKIT